jgi:hypothetical protein
VKATIAFLTFDSELTALADGGVELAAIEACASAQRLPDARQMGAAPGSSPAVACE